LGEERVGHQGEPLDRLPVRGGDGRGLAVPFDDELVDVRGVDGVEGLEAEVVEELRGRLLRTTLDTFDVDASRLHLDLTTIRFAGGYPDSTLVHKGWGSDRQVARQVRTLQASTPDGVALYLRPHTGSDAELTCLGQALETLQALTGPGLVIVADSAFGHLGSLCAADRKGLRFVVPLRADTGWADRFDSDVPAGLAALADLDHVAERERQLPPDQRTRWRGLLTAVGVTDPQQGSQHDLSVAYIWSSEEADSVRDARERALAKAETELTRVRNGLGGRYYKTIDQVRTKVARIVHPRISALLPVQTGTDPTGKPTLSWQRNHDAIAAASRLDGLYALATNLAGPLSALQVLEVYKDQWIVEQRHRDLKRAAPLRVRPVFLHNDDRIDALIGVVGIALLIFGLIEADLRRRLPADQPRLPGLLPEGRAAKPTGRNILAAFDGLGFTYTPRGPVLDPLTPTQRQILALLDIPLPWIEQAD
jgi:hypothetical protein